MKITKLLFISRANLKGAKRKKTVLVMMIISVIAITVLAGFLNIVNYNYTSKLNSPEFCQIQVEPEVVYPEVTFKGINEKTLDEVLSIEHVVSCEPQHYNEYQNFTINEITDENGNIIAKEDSETDFDVLKTIIDSYWIDDDLSVKSSIGKSLKDAPVMSCIIPDNGVLWDFETDRLTDYDISWLYGKVLMLDCNYNALVYNKADGSGIEQGGYTDELLELAELPLELKVVGVYSVAEFGPITGGNTLLVSPETAQIIEDMAVAQAQKTIPDKIEDYVNDPYARRYILTVDSRENSKDVETKLRDMGYLAIVSGIIEPSFEEFATIFSGAGTFLLIAIILLTVINLFLSVYSNIHERRSEIGLLKAIGYKNRQIFLSMYLENVIQAIRAIVIGGIISAIIVLIVDTINLNSSEFARRLLVISAGQFASYATLAFALILIIPLICQLIMTALIAKIQPQEAMNS